MPWECYQYIKFCPGYFHVKMAATDAPWRIMIRPALGHLDETCLMKDVAILRPKETGTIISKCDFCRMHQVIKHVRIARRLDCWQIAVEKAYPQYATLEDFAKSRPKLEELTAMATDLVQNYVATAHMLSSDRLKSDSEWDKQFENAKLMQHYFLLYEELSHSMNFGDIGQLERTLLPWILLFKATGKHKYATAMEKHLVETHFEYPEPLRHTIRYNMLVNPTGKAGKFCAVDWLVEAENCEIKVHHCGQGSNQTVKHMIAESALIGTFKAINDSVENNLLLNTTLAHGEPNMGQTFAELRKSLSQTSPHKLMPSRKSMYSIPNMLNKGGELLVTSGCTGETQMMWVMRMMQSQGRRPMTWS